MRTFSKVTKTQCMHLHTYVHTYVCECLLPLSCIAILFGMSAVSQFNVPLNFSELLQSQTHGPTTQLISAEVSVCVCVCGCGCVLCVFVVCVWVCGYVWVWVGGWVCCECVGLGVCCEYVLCVFVSTVHVCTCKYVSVGVLGVFVHVCISVCVYLCICMYVCAHVCVLFGWVLWMCYRCLSIYVHVCLTFLEGCTPLWYHC